MLLKDEQPNAGLLPWTESGKELLIRSLIWINDNGGCDAIAYNETKVQNTIFWTKEEETRLIELYAQKRHFELPNRSPMSINSKVSILLKRGRIKRYYPVNRFSKFQVDYLIACSISKHKPVIEGKTEAQLIEKMRTLGLSIKGLGLSRSR